VSGLRREEVAMLAGISVEYYTRLEGGSVGSVSESVLDGLVHALQLGEAERDHLYRLVRTASDPSSRRAPHRTPTKKRVRPAIERILDQMPMPAYLRNGQRINIYNASPDSPSEQALSLLASWSVGPPVGAPVANAVKNEETWNS
jgi:transcriptional regulator with XRE-family HTH domain